MLEVERLVFHHPVWLNGALVFGESHDISTEKSARALWMPLQGAAIHRDRRTVARYGSDVAGT